jgi:predicted phosphodiesterase
MEKNLDELLKIGNDGPAIESRRKRDSHPEGWSPALEFDGIQGVATLPPSDGVPDFDDFLKEQGFDPDEFEVIGSPRTSRWQRYDGEWLCAYRFSFRRKTEIEKADIDELVKSARRAKPKKIEAVENERAYFIQITDLQAGQADGDGAEGMVARALAIPQLVRDDLTALKKSGKAATSIFIPITGDLVEGVSGWYETQVFSVSLDRRDQVKLVRRLLMEILVDIGSLGLPVHVAVVPGNHGENRQNGKAYTTLHDNDDVAVVEQIAEALKLSGNFDNFTWSFPGRERLSLTVEVLGHVVGLTHGHIARGGTGVEGKVLGWFKSMAATRDPIGESDLLFTGHYHHARAQQLIGSTWWIQGGALCDTSAWFSQSAGLVSDPVLSKGTITRGQVIESLIPFAWSRTKVETKPVG